MFFSSGVLTRNFGKLEKAPLGLKNSASGREDMNPEEACHPERQRRNCSAALQVNEAAVLLAPRMQHYDRAFYSWCRLSCPQNADLGLILQPDHSATIHIPQRLIHPRLLQDRLNPLAHKIIHFLVKIECRN